MSGYFILACVPLFGVIFQDFKSRQIYWFWPPLLFLLFFVQSVQEASSIEIVKNVAISTLFVVVNLMIVSLYFSLKEKKWINIFKQHFGLGDFLFFLAITPVFSPLNFVLFFVISLILIGLLHAILITFGQLAITTVPLAGWLSVLLVIALLLNAFLFNINPLNDDLLINYIYFGAHNRDNPFY
ncbi:hypothetical protein [Acidiluteibacter ferrifornacis]|uniref:Uncharacterized protein n=1 Tax=Acidiluteibacter ferrifornacis TaxID=2692424 RepID=A0A6N9NFW1_9FLAO|nr:hypothetical protein [Acidiluteibacter ferrifornacis]NBG64763.1 hypothetical protein [Acidiluteibacter ferrifornacis]